MAKPAKKRLPAASPSDDSTRSGNVLMTEYEFEEDSGVSS
jgi:hypothetical protein